MILTTAILKQHLGGVQSKLDFSTVEPFAHFAERWFRDQIGGELMAYLAKLDTPAPNTNEAELLYLAQSCLAWQCYELAFPHLKLRASDLGLQKLNTQNTVAVAKWEYVDSREANLAMLDLALENFFSALEQIRPEVWTKSYAYQKRQLVWIRSATELAEHIPTLGRKNRLFQQLLTYVKRAEEIYIKPILTAPVYFDLKLKWGNPAATLTSQERQLIEAIKPALAHMTLYEVYPYLPLTLDVTGITESRSKDGTMEQVAPGQESKNGQKRALYTDGQYYLNELQEFLGATASPTQWPAYYQANLPGKPPELPDYTDSTLVIL